VVKTAARKLDAVGRKEPHHSFDRGDIHFVVLDACFRSDGKPYERQNSKGSTPTSPPTRSTGSRKT